MTNDPGDRQVLAAAVVSGAEGIVTLNARHVPYTALALFGKQRIDPDDFLFTPLDIDPLTVGNSLIEQAGQLKRPPLKPAQLLDHLERGRVGALAGRIREQLERR
jgi:hypothetical protein